MRLSAEAEDDAGRETHIILRRSSSGGVILEPGHQVFGLNKANGKMTLHLDVQAATSGHGKRVLGGEERAAECAFGE